MPKVSQVPPDNSPSLLDYLLGNQNSGPSTKIFSLQTLINFFWTLANIPTGATSPITRDGESQFAFIASGMVWTGDSLGVNRNASMTAGVCYINGRRISIAAVTARTFTASVDTYVDVLDNGDGTGTIVYTTATNNAASPALAANSMRIGIIITGATTIATAGSVNQGQYNCVLPIASSIAYTKTDSLGNIIAPRDPNRKVLGYRQIITNFSFTTLVDVTGIAVPFIAPGLRDVKATLVTSGYLASVSGDIASINLQEGATIFGGGTYLQPNTAGSTSQTPIISGVAPTPPSAGLHTYKATGQRVVGSGSQTLSGTSANSPIFLIVEME